MGRCNYQRIKKMVWLSSYNGDGPEKYHWRLLVHESSDRAPYFRKTMSRDRFRQILQYLHFSDNDEIPTDSTNRLIKIQNIIDYFTKKFQEVYKPNQNLPLDEGMIPWRGRLKCRVYNPMKIVKYGILNRMICE